MGVPSLRIHGVEHEQRLVGERLHVVHDAQSGTDVRVEALDEGSAGIVDDDQGIALFRRGA
jgi:hypothetical protein